MPADPKRVESLFTRARDIPASADRAAFLADEARGDDELRGRVERLLAAHAELDSQSQSHAAGDSPIDMHAGLERLATADATAAFAGTTETAGAVIGGKYKLLERIGEGGMGTVWMAEQTEPVQRRVALKVIKAGMDSRMVVTRFEAERQALALMDHPNIARVLDGGASPDGRPYFVMELVKGIPITKYCDEKKLPVPERLALFADVCRAVQHAHQKGIIHRDLKPNNVLVAPYDGRPVVKVIDFGVAKATGQKLTEATLFTGFGAIVGTLEYMSPEQAELNNQDVDTRSDVYSLGVLLYELLTGTTPLTRKRLKNAALMEVLRMVREEEPPKPSTRLSSTDELPTIAAVRGVEPAKLSRLVRGELDWIVLKALNKDRSRRYESANGFAMDVQRYLAAEPVHACPPTAGYRFQKFALRNKAALTTASLVASALIGGTIISTLQTIRAKRAEGDAVIAWTEESQQRQDANQQRDEARALNNQLRRTLYAANMNLAHQAWDVSNLERMKELLEQHLPKPGELDLRGFEWNYLNRLCRSSMLTLNDKAVRLGSAAFNPDGQRLVGNTQGGLVKVWDAQTAKVLLTIQNQSGIVGYSPDGTRLVGAANGSIRIWDALSGEIILTIKCTDSIVSYSPDGKLLACAGGQTVTMRNAHTGQIVSSQKFTDVRNVIFSPDGKRLAISSNSDVKVCEVQDYKEIHTFAGHTGNITSVAFSPDGKRLASASLDTSVKLWDVESGRELLVIYSRFGPVFNVAFSPNGNSLATVNQGIVRLWSSQTGQQMQVLKGQLSGVAGLAFSPDGKRLASGSTVFDTQSDQEVLTLKGHKSIVNNIAFSRDGKRLVSSSTDNTVKLWETIRGAESRTFSGRMGNLTSVAFDRNGENVVSAYTNDLSVKGWELETGLATINFKGPTHAHKIAVSPDGKRLAVAYRDNNDKTKNSVNIWDIETGLSTHTLKGHTELVQSLAFSPDGKRLGSGAANGLLIVWDTQSGKELLNVKGFAGVIYGLGFSPDSQQLACACLIDRLIKIWDVSSGQVTLTLNGHASGNTDVIFSGDGQRLISASLDHSIKVWDVLSGQETLTLKGHTSRINRVILSPDGHKLASCSGDGTVKIWDATPVPERSSADLQKDP